MASDRDGGFADLLHQVLYVSGIVEPNWYFPGYCISLSEHIILRMMLTRAQKSADQRELSSSLRARSLKRCFVMELSAVNLVAFFIALIYSFTVLETLVLSIVLLLCVHTSVYKNCFKHAQICGTHQGK